MSKSTKEFKLEIAKHCVSSQDGFQATADKFSVPRSLVRNWVDVYKYLEPKGLTLVKRAAQRNPS